MTTFIRSPAGMPLFEAATPDLTGLPEGSLVLTLDGELPVEHLAPGDRVVARDCGMAILRRLRVTEAVIAPIEIRAGSLGHTRPGRDTAVAPGTRLHIRDWRARAIYGSPAANVPARRLIDGEFIAEGARRHLRLYDLVFDRPHILYADGLEVAAAEV